MVFKRHQGFTFVEVILVIFLSIVLLFSAVAFNRLLVRTTANEQKNLLLVDIRTMINSASSEGMEDLRKKTLLIKEGETLYGFEFQSHLSLDFNHYGQIEQGDAVTLKKEDQSYLLSVEPVTAKVSLKKIL